MPRDESVRYEQEDLCVRLKAAQDHVTKTRRWLQQAAQEIAVIEREDEKTRAAYDTAKAYRETLRSRDVVSLADWETATNTLDGAGDVMREFTERMAMAYNKILERKRFLEAQERIVIELQAQIDGFCTVLPFRRSV